MVEADKGLLLYVIGCAFFSACVCELISWFLVYRRDDYQRLYVQFTNASKRLERKKEVPAQLKKGEKKDKKLVMLEREFGHAKRDMVAFKVRIRRANQINACSMCLTGAVLAQSRCNMLTALFHSVTFFTLKASYDGMVLARLPFIPFGFVQSVSHRNVPGNDMQECSIIFIYMLCSLAIKPNLQKILGHETPRSATPDTEAAAKMAERLMVSMGVPVPS